MAKTTDKTTEHAKTNAQPAKPTIPAVPEKPAKPERKGRPAHPLVGNADTNVYPFKELPADFDFKTMRGLSKKDFATDAAFFEYKAKGLEAQAANFRVLAENARKLGSSAERNKAKKLVKLQEQMAELSKQLAAQGIDVNALLAAKTDAA